MGFVWHCYSLEIYTLEENYKGKQEDGFIALTGVIIIPEEGPAWDWTSGNTVNILFLDSGDIYFLMYISYNKKKKYLGNELMGSNTVNGNRSRPRILEHWSQGNLHRFSNHEP